MDLYLVITDDNYSWIGVVEKKSDSYWVEYGLSRDYPSQKLWTGEGYLHRGPSYLIDVDVWNWRGNFKDWSLAHEFSVWYKGVYRDNILGELGI